MKHLKPLVPIAGLFILFTSCNDGGAGTEAAATPETAQATKPDMAQIKQEIQALETAFAKADNERDANTIAAFYANDAVSVEPDHALLVGNDAIKKSVEENLAKRSGGSTVSYDIIDITGDDHMVTEIGKTTRMDSTGKVISTGKYMAVWEKRDGKWLCIRDIAVDDKQVQ